MYRVTLADQTTYEGKIVGFDQDKDVAVLRIDAPKDKLRPIPVGISADLLVGQKVFAIGNPVSILALIFHFFPLHMMSENKIRDFLPKAYTFSH